MIALTAGKPAPLGASYDGKGVNFALFSAHAERVELCVFDDQGNERRVDMPARSGDIWHGWLADAGPGLRYGYRVHGPWDPAQGHRFNPAKLLLDPWATRLDRAAPLVPAMFDRRETGAPHDDADSGPVVAKAVVEAAFVPPAAPTRPAFRWRDAVVYELHVRGFTRAHPDVPEAIRGTFAGLAHPAAIDHLVRLGVTAVEIMPAAAWLDERHLPPLGLTNYWGYNPIALCAPDPRLAPTGWAEIRAATDALHAAGIAAILDVVLNHTGESDRLGPTVSLRGLDNTTWYRLVPGSAADYLNDTGCGNMLALDRSIPLRLALDSLRLWVERGGVRLELRQFAGRQHDLEPVEDPQPLELAGLQLVLAVRQHAQRQSTIGKQVQCRDRVRIRGPVLPVVREVVLEQTVDAAGVGIDPQGPHQICHPPAPLLLEADESTGVVAEVHPLECHPPVWRVVGHGPVTVRDEVGDGGTRRALVVEERSVEVEADGGSGRHRQPGRPRR